MQSGCPHYIAQAKYYARLTYDLHKHSIGANRVQLTPSQAPLE